MGESDDSPSNGRTMCESPADVDIRLRLAEYTFFEFSPRGRRAENICLEPPFLAHDANHVLGEWRAAKTIREIISHLRPMPSGRSRRSRAACANKIERASSELTPQPEVAAIPGIGAHGMFDNSTKTSVF